MKSARPFHFQDHHFLELLLARLAFAVVVWISLPAEIAESLQSHPNGLAHWIDFRWIADPDILRSMRWGALLALGLYVLGSRPGMMLALPFLFFFSLADRTLANSHGNIHHGYQIVTMVLLAQTLVVLLSPLVARAWTWWADHRLGRQLMFYSAVVITGCYATSAVTKLDATDGKWAWQGPNIGIQLVKTDRQNYYNHLNREGENFAPAGGTIPAAANGLMEHPMLARAAMACGLLLELFAFLALAGRFPALLIGISLIAMHRGIEHWMGLTFEFNEYLVLIFLINLPYWFIRAKSAIESKSAKSLGSRSEQG